MFFFCIIIIITIIQYTPITTIGGNFLCWNALLKIRNHLSIRYPVLSLAHRFDLIDLIHVDSDLIQAAAVTENKNGPSPQIKKPLDSLAQSLQVARQQTPRLQEVVAPGKGPPLQKAPQEVTDQSAHKAFRG